MNEPIDDLCAKIEALVEQAQALGRDLERKRCAGIAETYYRESAGQRVRQSAAQDIWTRIRTNE